MISKSSNILKNEFKSAKVDHRQVFIHRILRVDIGSNLPNSDLLAHIKLLHFSTLSPNGKHYQSQQQNAGCRISSFLSILLDHFFPRYSKIVVFSSSVSLLITRIGRIIFNSLSRILCLDSNRLISTLVL